MRSFKSSEHINEKLDGPYHGCSYLRFGNMEPKSITVIMNLFKMSMYDRIRKYSTTKPMGHANMLLNQTDHYICFNLK